MLATVLAVHSSALELDRMLREDPALRGVVVRDGGHLLLLTRAHADHLLAGPFGFGRALLARRDLRALLPESTLVVAAETPIPVLAWMLARSPAERYDDAVVTWADGAVGLAPTSVVFEVMSQPYQQVALHDPLTGLPNRLVIEHEAAGLLTGARGQPATSGRPCCMWTWTGSRTSTTRSATAPATRSSWRSPRG